MEILLCWKNDCLSVFIFLSLMTIFRKPRFSSILTISLLYHSLVGLYATSVGLNRAQVMPNHSVVKIDRTCANLHHTRVMLDHAIIGR
jgi:hypothetical protein